MTTTTTIALTVNGIERSVSVHPMTRLLDVLRETLDLPGTKEGCGEGECGACSVLIDGALVNACLVPVLQVRGCAVDTIEGIASAGALTPVQCAFIEHGGAQCGICTPGMIVAATALLRRDPQPDVAAIREGLAGNLCRCTGYVKIVDAVAAAAAAGAKESAR